MPVVAAVDATLQWVNGDADASVFKSVDMVLGPLDLPLKSRYKATDAERQQARGWLHAVGKAVARNRAKAQQEGAVVPRALPKVRREVWAELRTLTAAFSLQPQLTTRGIEYVVTARAFVPSTPLVWAALATAELMTYPDRHHFIECPGCSRFSVDIRQGRGKRRNRFCSKKCQDRIGQKEWWAGQPKRKPTRKPKRER